jgi:hypothetical protein
MDAATLCIVLTLPNGERTTSTADFSTLWKCEQKIVWLKLIERRHPQPPGAVTSYRCDEHKIRRASMPTSMVGAADPATSLGQHHVGAVLRING